jgi:hypothetical protein
VRAVERVVLVVVVGCGLACEEAAEDGPAVGLELQVESRPADGATAVPVGLWPELRVAPPGAAEGIDGVGLRCADAEIPSRVHRLADGRIVVQPEQRLPADQLCRLAWSQSGSPRSAAFETFRASAAPGRALSVVYRRSDPGEVAPVPDDFWTVPDPSTPTGLRLELPVAVRGDVREVIEGLRAELAQADGWSPIGPIVVPISDRIDVDSIPRTVDASLDPTATIALVDVDPASPGRGERWPFEAVVRKDKSSIGLEDHALWVLPARPLRPGGRYALLMRRGVASRVGRSMIEPSSIRSILERRGALAIGAKAVIEAQLRPVLAVSDAALAIPWTRDDLVFALPFTVRSLATLARDPLALLADVRALPGPRVEIERVEVVRDPARPLAALVQGRFAVPVWRDRRVRRIARTADGRPFVVGRDKLRFVLALPRRAIERPAPLLMYQHGNPGSAAEEIGSPRQDAYLEAGFAVVGFTDLWNRGKPQGGADRRQVVVRQVAALADSVRRKGIVPDDWLVTLGEQLALVEALPRARLPRRAARFAAPGRPAPRSTRRFRSSTRASARARSTARRSSPTAIASAPRPSWPAARASTELALHQAASSMVKALPFLFGDFRPLDLWVTLALFQTAIDRQDAHLHALRLHRRRRPGRPRVDAPPRRLQSSLGGESRMAEPAADRGLPGTAYIPTAGEPLARVGAGAAARGSRRRRRAGSRFRARSPRCAAISRTGRRARTSRSCPTVRRCRRRRAAGPRRCRCRRRCSARAISARSSPRRASGGGWQFLRAAVDAAPPTVIDPFARRRRRAG